jgi:hypothetical protein
MMAQIKDMEAGTDGDSFSVGGTLSVTGTSSFTGAITASGGITGTLTGNVTGNLAGNVTGATTGAHNGTVGATTPSTGAFTTVSASSGFTGNLTGNVTGTLTGAIASSTTATTQTAGDNSTKVATTAFATTAIQALYPVGSIYSSTVSTNPATLFGFGTWVAFGEGRVMIGVGGGFSAGATGGSADAVVVSHTHTFTGDALPAHSHEYTRYSSLQVQSGSATPCWAGTSTQSTSSVSGGTPTGTNSTTGVSGTNANLQPYIVVYMWNRTA